jgi:hypothetical protein
MRVIRGFSVLLLILAALLLSGQTVAQSDQGESARVFGLGQPHSIQSLPAGKLRSRLESLPPQASAKALRWLQDFSFPEADLDTIEVDAEGSVFYGDTLLPNPEKMEASESAGPTLPADAPIATLDDAFLLHSRPGSSNVVFIDFDGAVITGTAWNGSFSQLDALPYNVEGDGSTFSTLERTRIVDIWHRVAEDLAPYDIDVTTEEPATFNSTTGTILVTHSVDANGHNINCTSCGGVAYVGVFGRSNYHTYYSPALVFFNKLGSGNETYVAEASSHEFGHNLNLSHDGTNAGAAYYAGHGSGLVSWAPIMGNSYNNNVTEWSIGEYPDANQQQDDLAIIDGKLGYRPDDHGDTRAAAATLAVDSDGSVVSSNPELDPHNVLPENKGVIGSSADVDVFSFVTGTGTINLTVNPGWDAFYRSSSRRGANLDIEAELQDLSGDTLALNDPTTDTGASISASVSAGTYYLLITGVGNTATPYSDYDSLGQYFINGSVPPASADTTAPTPDPMTWASVPSAASHTAINMTASTAVDDISAVEYNFLCITDAGCANSGWQSGAGYTATGLAASTSYTFRVMARDQAGNETESSVSASATTDAPPPPPVAPSNLSAAGISETAISLNWTDNATNETAYRVERSPDGLNNFATIANLASNATSYTDTGLSADTTYDYRVAAVNDSGDSGFDNAGGTTDAPPPYTNYGASSDTAMAGSVSGSVTNTRSDDDSTQSITERESGGKPANRYAYLEHRWNFNVSLGATATVYANVWSGSSTGDTFWVEYSLDNGGNFSRLSQFNVSTTESSNLQSDVIPGKPSGSIIIRVVDNDHARGNRDKNTVFVDHLYIQVGNPSSDPPIGVPGGLAANAVSSSQIDLSWTDGTENEAGFTVDRSPDGSNGWSQIADLPGGSTSYIDTGLTAETAYFYRVRAYNPNGFSVYTYANATTPIAPPPPALSLNANAYKVKGKHHVGLSWSGSSSVDVYRNGSLLNPSGVVTGSNYDDNIGAKGGATYTHKVCAAGTTTCSNTTTSIF